MRPLCASFLVFIATMPLHGQTGSSTSGGLQQSLAIAPETHSDGCPVGFWAKRSSGLRVLRASDSGQSGPTLGLDILLDHRSAPEIQSVEVTVHGVTTRLRALPAGVSSSDEVTKIFQLQRASGEKGLSDASVRVPKAGALTRVDLNSVTYTDGSTWHDSKSLRCQAVPNNLVLVGR